MWTSIYGIGWFLVKIHLKSIKEFMKFIELTASMSIGKTCWCLKFCTNSEWKSRTSKNWNRYKLEYTSFFFYSNNFSASNVFNKMLIWLVWAVEIKSHSRALHCIQMFQYEKPESRKQLRCRKHHQTKIREDE